MQRLDNIPLNKIVTRSNYRKTFNDKSLKELAQSIKINGVLEPVIVRPQAEMFEIVAGERRYRASVLAGVVTIPAVVRETADDQILSLQIVENVQREGVPFMEEADAIKQLSDQCTLDVKEIAQMIGKSDAYVYYQLKLTSMSQSAQTIARNGWISKGVAWEISKLPNTDMQTQAAEALARTNRDKLITASGAKHYIRDTFQGDTSQTMRKRRVSQIGPGSDYVANWKKYLVRFSAGQFERFKNVVRGRTETDVLAEAVDLVMREAGEKELAAAMDA